MLWSRQTDAPQLPVPARRRPDRSAPNNTACLGADWAQASRILRRSQNETRCLSPTRKSVPDPQAIGSAQRGQWLRCWTRRHFASDKASNGTGTASAWRRPPQTQPTHRDTFLASGSPEMSGLEAFDIGQLLCRKSNRTRGAAPCGVGTSMAAPSLPDRKLARPKFDKSETCRSAQASRFPMKTIVTSRRWRPASLARHKACAVMIVWKANT